MMGGASPSAGLCPQFACRFKMPVYKPPQRAPAVGFNAHEQTRLVGSRFVMGKRQRLQIRGHAPPASRGIHFPQAGGKRAGIGGAAQSQRLVALQQRFKSPSDFCPKLNLPGHRALTRLASQAGVQQQAVRNFHWLTHIHKVAKCYRLSRAGWADGIF